MRKIPTLFMRGGDFKVIPENNPEAEWALGDETGVGRATEKLDGTNVRIRVLGGQLVGLEKRRNPSREEKAAGAEPSYVNANRTDPSDKWMFAALDNTHIVKAATDTFSGFPLTMIEQTNYVEGRIYLPDGTWPCEAVGPKIQGNPYDLPKQVLYPFSYMPIDLGEVPRTFEGLRSWFRQRESVFRPGHPMEGVVFHHGDGRMAKIKASDFK